MQRARILLGLGVWVAILPYLGFPYSWKVVLLTLTGLGLVYLSYDLYQEDKHGDGVFDNFKENGSLFVRHAVKSIEPETENPPESIVTENQEVNNG